MNAYYERMSRVVAEALENGPPHWLDERIDRQMRCKRGVLDTLCKRWEEARG